MGVIFTAMFSVVGLRLWFIQVAEGPQIARAAEESTWVGKTTYAPRGDIYDRNGTLLATSRMVPAVMIDRTFVQPEQKEPLIQELASIVGVDPVEIDAMYEEAGINGRFQVSTVTNETAYAINETLDELPGVEVVKVPERVYLTGPTMAHVIGHLGLPEQADLDEREDLDRDVRIGKLGVERVYDEVLQGTGGSVEYRVRRGEIIEQRRTGRPGDGQLDRAQSRPRTSGAGRARPRERGGPVQRRSRRRREPTGRRSSTRPRGPRRSFSTSTTSMCLPSPRFPTSTLSYSSPASTSRPSAD